MSRLHFEEARTEEQFAALSLIHALGWRTTYAGAIPADFMAREITADRWVPTFRENLKTNRNQLLLLYDEDIPVCCATFGPARIDAGLQAGTVCKFNSRGYEGWGEIISFYTHPDHKRKGYGAKLMEEVLRRLSGQLQRPPHICLMVHALCPLCPSRMMIRMINKCSGFGHPMQGGGAKRQGRPHQKEGPALHPDPGRSALGQSWGIMPR